MDLQWFEASLSSEVPPEGLTPLLQALWHEGEGKGDWDKAHKVVQDIPGASAAWVHAYLHRKGGIHGTPTTGIPMRVVSGLPSH